MKRHTGSDTEAKGLNRTWIPLLVASAGSGFALGLTAPVLSAYFSSITKSVGVVATLWSLRSVLALVSRVTIATMTDRTPPLRIMTVLLGLQAASLLVLGSSRGLAPAGLAVLTLSVGSVAQYMVYIEFMRLEPAARKQALALSLSSFTLAYTVVGPALASLSAKWISLQQLFIAGAVLIFVCAGAVVPLLRARKNEGPASTSPGSRLSWRAGAELLRRAWGPLGGSFCSGVHSSILYTFLPILAMSKLDVARGVFSGVWALGCLTVPLAQYMSASVRLKAAAAAVVQACICLASAEMLAFAYISTLAQMAVVLSAFNFTTAFKDADLLSALAKSVPPGDIGKATGLSAAAFDLGALVFNSLGGILWDRWGAGACFAGAGLLTSIPGLLWASSEHQTRRKTRLSRTEKTGHRGATG